MLSANNTKRQEKSELRPNRCFHRDNINQRCKNTLVIYGNGVHADIGISIFHIQTETQRAVTAYPFDHPCNALRLLFQPSSPYSCAPWLFHLVTRPIFIQIHLGAPPSVGRGSAGRFASLQAGPLPPIPSRFSDLRRSPFSSPRFP